jgi:hypothetical protein
MTLDDAKKYWDKAKECPKTAILVILCLLFWHSRTLTNKIQDAKEIINSYTVESNRNGIEGKYSNCYKFQFLTSNGEVSNRGELHCNGKSYPPDTLGVFKIPTSELGVSANGRYIRDEETCYDEKLPLDSTQIKELQTECL